MCVQLTKTEFAIYPQESGENKKKLLLTAQQELKRREKIKQEPYDR